MYYYFSSLIVCFVFRFRVIEDLVTKFVVNEKPLKVISAPNKIIAKGINSDTDPYSVFIRLLEAISH